MEYTIKISGVDVEISRIYQKKSYASLIEGEPDKELNDEILGYIKDSAKDIFRTNSIHVIDPREHEDDNFPPYVLILELFSHHIFWNPYMHYSVMWVICFQDEFAFPISAKNLYYLKEIPFKFF